MFDLQSFECGKNGVYSCFALCERNSLAEEIRSDFIGPVRQINMFADLYCTGSKLILEAPDKETLLKIADILNHAAPWKKKRPET